MKLPIIQSLWIGAGLSNMEKLCVQSFLDNGHEFHLYTYTAVDGVPDGTVIKDANEILPESEIFYNSNGGVTAFSDWFRFEMLNKCGGFWVDMDVVCLHPFAFDSEFIFCGDTRGISVAVLRFPKGHELMQAMSKVGKNHTEIFPWEDADTRKKKIKKRILRRGKDGMEFDSPAAQNGLTNAANHFGVTHHAKPPMYFSQSVTWIGKQFMTPLSAKE